MSFIKIPDWTIGRSVGPKVQLVADQPLRPAGTALPPLRLSPTGSAKVFTVGDCRVAAPSDSEALTVSASVITSKFTGNAVGAVEDLQVLGTAAVASASSGISR